LVEVLLRLSTTPSTPSTPLSDDDDDDDDDDNRFVPLSFDPPEQETLFVLQCRLVCLRVLLTLLSTTTTGTTTNGTTNDGTTTVSIPLLRAMFDLASTNHSLPVPSQGEPRATTNSDGRHISTNHATSKIKVYGDRGQRYRRTTRIL